VRQVRASGVGAVGLLLAAGAGRRMGGPKALLRPAPDAPTFVESAIAALRAAGLTRVVVVVGAGAATVAPLAEHAGAITVRATAWPQGMGASLRTGLAHLAADEDGVGLALVTLVDLPDIGADVHRRVLAAAASGRSERAVLVRATYRGRPGHPVLIGADHWAAVSETASGDIGARGYLASADVRDVECGDLATGRDVDTPADLTDPAASGHA
jgi:CTP:molybdopterin cytidylyltransferase MocA